MDLLSQILFLLQHHVDTIHSVMNAGLLAPIVYDSAYHVPSPSLAVAEANLPVHLAPAVMEELC